MRGEPGESARAVLLRMPPCHQSYASVTRRLRAWEAATLGPLMLPSSLLEATTLHLGMPEMLRPVVQRLASCNEGRGFGDLNLVAVGASVTYGHGMRDQAMAWPAILERALREIWGMDNVHVTNAAIPATSAQFAELCLDTLVRADADVVFIEYAHTSRREDQIAPLIDAVTDRGAVPFGVDYTHLLKGPPAAWRACQGRTPGRTKDGRVCTLATHGMIQRPEKLEIPRRAFTSRSLPIVSSDPLLRWFRGKLSSVQPAPTFSDLARLMTRDGLHATHYYHRFLAAMVVRALWQVHRESEAASWSQAVLAVGSQAQRRPRQLLSKPVCAIGHSLEKLRAGIGTTVDDGWHLLTENDKTGLAATVPGSELTLRLPRGASFASSRVYLTYLRSYAHMGTARLSCSGACACETATYDAHTVRNTSLAFTGPAVLLLSRARGEQPRAAATVCTLRLRVLEGTRSGEHKFKLMALTVVPPQLADAQKGGGSSMGQKRIAMLNAELMTHVLNSSWRRA